MEEVNKHQLFQCEFCNFEFKNMRTTSDHKRTKKTQFQGARFRRCPEGPKKHGLRALLLPPKLLKSSISHETSPIIHSCQDQEWAFRARLPRKLIADDQSWTCRTTTAMFCSIAITPLMLYSTLLLLYSAASLLYCYWLTMATWLEVQLIPNSSDHETRQRSW